MSNALYFLVRRSFIGGLKHRLSRLKQIKYLAPAIMGVLYFSFMFLPRFLGDHNNERLTRVHDLMVQGIPLLLILALGVAWLIDFQKGGLPLSETEGELLFAAPLSRTQLVAYCMYKSQPRLLFSSVIFGLFTSFSLQPPSMIYFWLQIYLLLNLFKAVGLAIALTWCALQKRLLHWPLRLSVPLLLWASMLAGLKDFLSSRFPTLNEVVLPGGLVTFFEALRVPFQAMIQSLFANSWQLAYPGMVITVGLAILCFFWATKMDVAFEENTLAYAQKRLAQLKRMRRTSGPSKPHKQRVKTWLPLAETGPVWRAVIWKTMVSFTRGPAYSTLIFFTIIVIGLWSGSLALGYGVFNLILAMMMLPFLLLLPFLGPPFLRLDFRAELDQLELIKTFPISARQIFFAQVIPTAAMTAMIQLGLMVMIIISFYRSDELTVDHWMLGLAGLFVLPALSWATVTVENCLMLWLPAWFVLSQKGMDKGGIEFIGRGMISIFVRSLGLVILMLLPATAALVVILPGAVILGEAALVIGAALGSAILVVETVLIGGNVAVFYDGLEPGSNELT